MDITFLNLKITMDRYSLDISLNCLFLLLSIFIFISYILLTMPLLRLWRYPFMHQFTEYISCHTNILVTHKTVYIWRAIKMFALYFSPITRNKCTELARQSTQKNWTGGEEAATIRIPRFKGAKAIHSVHNWKSLWK